MPMAVKFAPVSLTTTAFEPILAFSPMVILPSTLAPEPMITPFLWLDGV